MRLVLLQAVLLGLLLLAYAIAPGWARFPVGPWARAAALGLLAIAIAMALAAFLAIGRSFRVHPRPKSDGRLVTGGIYAHLRHPMYTAVILICLALSLESGDAAVATLGLVTIAFYLAKARYEERLLLRHYPAYERYRRQTWSIFPWGRRTRSASPLGPPAS